MRVQPDMRHLYLLIKAPNASCAKLRLKEEILCSNLFKCLQSRHGEEYEAFMEQKITPVVGDMTKEMLGMDPFTFTFLATRINRIVNSTATTSFDEHYDHALNMNTRGTRRIMEFAKCCQHLQLLMHVSTGDVNMDRLIHQTTLLTT